MQQFLLAGGQVGGGLDEQLDHQVAARAAVQMGHALALDPDGLAGLGPRRHGDGGLALAVAGVGHQAGGVDLAAQGRDGHGNRHGDQQVQVVALEQVVRRHRQEDVQVAARAAALTGVALARQADARAVVDAGGDLQVQGAGLADLAVAVTGRAGVGDHLARAVAAGAGPLDLEEAVGLAYAAGAVAGGAGDGLGAGPGPRAFAGLAGHGGGDVDLDLGALVGLFQADLEIIAQVRAATRSALLAPARLATAEGVSEGVAEDLGEDVVDVGEALLALAEAAAPAAVHAGVAEPVVGRALLIVRKDRIGLGNFLELGHRLFRAAVAIRVMDHGQLAIGRFQTGCVDCPFDAQNLIIVTRHRALVLILPLRLRHASAGVSEAVVSRLTWGPERLMQVS